MISIKKILVPTDFSDNSVFAYTHAQELAQTFGANIDMIHIVPTLKYFSESIGKLGIPFDMEKELFPKILEEAEHKLNNALDDYVSEENRGRAIAVTSRKPSQAITDRAKEEGYDLIVMAARGEHASDLIKGTVTEKVIRQSDVPVFAVDERVKMDQIKTILVPTDTSAISYTCFPMALALADAYEAEITLFHVLELYGSISENLPRTPERGEKEDIYEAIIEGLDDYLLNKNHDDILIRRSEVLFEDQVVITDNASSKSINLKTVIEKGVSAHYKIEEYAPEHADLVVMTTHGHSGLAHFFLGSTTEKVAQHLEMPVVTVKPHPEDLN